MISNILPMAKEGVSFRLHGGHSPVKMFSQLLVDYHYDVPNRLLPTADDGCVTPCALVKIVLLAFALLRLRSASPSAVTSPDTNCGAGVGVGGAVACPPKQPR